MKKKKVLEAVIKEELKNIKNADDKARRAKEISHNAFIYAGLSTYESSPASNVLSGIVRYARSAAEAQATEKENKRMATSGRKCSNAGKLSKENVTLDAEKYWTTVQDKANPIWQNNHGLSCSQVAKILKERFPDLLSNKSISTIRQRIKKPL